MQINVVINNNAVFTTILQLLITEQDVKKVRCLCIEWLCWPNISSKYKDISVIKYRAIYVLSDLMLNQKYSMILSLPTQLQLLGCNGVCEGCCWCCWDGCWCCDTCVVESRCCCCRLWFWGWLWCEVGVTFPLTFPDVLLDDVETDIEEDVSAVTQKSSALISDLISGRFVTTLSIFNIGIFW